MALNKVEICGVNTSSLPVLKQEEKDELFRRIKQGDTEAREQYIKGNLRLVLSVIRRFQNSNENPDDLFQIGCIGLMKAVDNFDDTLMVKFSTYAVPMIIGEIRRYLRDDGMLKVSRSLKETAWKVRKAEADWQNTVGREPTLEELSEKTGIRKEEIVQSLAANTEVDSLHRSIPGNQGKEITLGEQICDRHNEIEERTDHLFLEQLLDTLEAKEQQLIYLRYVEEKTQSEVAKIMGTTQVQISRREKKLLAKLRERA